MSKNINIILFLIIIIGVSHISPEIYADYLPYESFDQNSISENSIYIYPDSSLQYYDIMNDTYYDNFDTDSINNFLEEYDIPEFNSFEEYNNEILGYMNINITNIYTNQEINQILEEMEIDYFEQDIYINTFYDWFNEEIQFNCAMSGQNSLSEMEENELDELINELSVIFSESNINIGYDRDDIQFFLNEFTDLRMEAERSCGRVPINTVPDGALVESVTFEGFEQDIKIYAFHEDHIKPSYVTNESTCQRAMNNHNNYRWEYLFEYCTISNDGSCVLQLRKEGYELYYFESGNKYYLIIGELSSQTYYTNNFTLEQN